MLCPILCNSSNSLKHPLPHQQIDKIVIKSSCCFIASIWPINLLKMSLHQNATANNLDVFNSQWRATHKVWFYFDIVIQRSRFFDLAENTCKYAFSRYLQTRTLGAPQFCRSCSKKRYALFNYANSQKIINLEMDNNLIGSCSILL